MSEQTETSSELNDLMFTAIDHGIYSIDDGAGPLIPFALILDDSGEKTLHRFVTERLEQGVEKAKKYLEAEKTKIKIYAIAWDGYITIDETKYDAILVEAGERDKESGFLLAQRYKQKGWFKKKIYLIGNPVQIGQPISEIYDT